jgi:hypothetical protein
VKPGDIVLGSGEVVSPEEYQRRLALLAPGRRRRQEAIREHFAAVAATLRAAGVVSAEPEGYREDGSMVIDFTSLSQNDLARKMRADVKTWALHALIERWRELAGCEERLTDYMEVIAVGMEISSRVLPAGVSQRAVEAGVSKEALAILLDVAEVTIPSE